MFRRRFTPARRSFPRRRFGRGTRLRAAATPNRRFQPINFAWQFDHVADPGQTTNVVVTMATLRQLQGIAAPTAVDFNWTEQARGFEVGGIVFNWCLVPFWENPVGGTGIALSAFYARLLLVTDRLLTDAQPASVATPWFNSQVPVANADSQSELELHDDFPARIHWQVGRSFNLATINGGTATNPFPATPAVAISQGTVSKRLRLFVGQDQGLFFHTAGLAQAFFDPELVAGVTFIVHGTMYARLRM